MSFTRFTQQPGEAGIIIITPTVRMRSLKLRKVQRFTQGVIAPQWQSCVSSVLISSIWYSVLCWPLNAEEGLQGQCSHRCTCFWDIGWDAFKSGVINWIVSVWMRLVAGDGFWSLILVCWEEAHHRGDSSDRAGGSKALGAEMYSFAYVCKSSALKWQVTGSVIFINPSLAFSHCVVRRFEWWFSRDCYLLSNEIIE